MSEKYNPVAFNPRAFAEEASKRDPAFREAYEGMADEFAALAINNEVVDFFKQKSTIPRIHIGGIRFKIIPLLACLRVKMKFTFWEYKLSRIRSRNVFQSFV